MGITKPNDKVRDAMWEAWEARVLQLKQEHSGLRGQVQHLQERNTTEVELRRAAENKTRDLRKVVWGLEQLVADLLENPTQQPNTDVPRCDVPTLDLKGRCG